MEPTIITGNEAYRPEAEKLIESMRAKPHDDKVDLVASALMARFAAGLKADWMRVIDESHVASGLTSAAARLIGLSMRDGHPEYIDQCAEALTRVVDDLEAFSMLAGSDTGAESIQTVLRELVGYMKARDYAAASAALDRRLTASRGARPRCPPDAGEP